MGIYSIAGKTFKATSKAGLEALAKQADTAMRAAARQLDEAAAAIAKISTNNIRERAIATAKVAAKKRALEISKKTLADIKTAAAKATDDAVTSAAKSTTKQADEAATAAAKATAKQADEAATAAAKATAKQADKAAAAAAKATAKQADDAAKKALKEVTGEAAEKAAKESAGEGLEAAGKKAKNFFTKNPKLVIAGLVGAAAAGYLIHRFMKNDNVKLKITKIERLSGLLSSSDNICDFHLAVEGRDMPEINDAGAIFIDTLNPNVPQLITKKLNFVKVLDPKIVRIDISQIPDFANIKFDGLVGTCTYRTSFQGELAASIKETTKSIAGAALENIVNPIIGGIGDSLGFNFSPNTIKIIFLCIVILIVLGIFRYTGILGTISHIFNSGNRKSGSYYYYGAGLPSV